MRTRATQEEIDIKKKKERERHWETDIGEQRLRETRKERGGTTDTQRKKEKDRVKVRERKRERERRREFASTRERRERERERVLRDLRGRESEGSRETESDGERGLQTDTKRARQRKWDRNGGRERLIYTNICVCSFVSVFACACHDLTYSRTTAFESITWRFIWIPAMDRQRETYKRTYMCICVQEREDLPYLQKSHL